MLDGLPQRLFFGLLQCRGRLLVEARRKFAVGAEDVGNERRRHFVRLSAGVIGVFGNGARRHFVGEPGVAFGIADGKSRGGARA